jgi:hypothetical protein
MFDGTQVVVLPPLVSAAPHSISMWIKCDVNANPMYMFAKPHSDIDAWDTSSLAVTAAGQLDFETTSTATYADYLFSASGSELRTQTWRHVAATWDGATKQVYVDGVLSTSSAATILDSTLPSRLGADVDGGTPLHFYVGGMDEVRIYARALSANEVAMLANP